MNNPRDSLLILGGGGSGKTTLLLERIAECFTGAEFVHQAVILCASPARAEDFRTRLRRYFLDLARQTGENRWITGAFSCGQMRIFTPENPAVYIEAPMYIFADDFDRYPEELQENIRRFLPDFTGCFTITSSPDCLPAQHCITTELSHAYRADHSLQNLLNPILGSTSRQGMRRDNDAYARDKFFRFIPLQNVTQRGDALTAELARLKRRRDYEKSTGNPPRISIVCHTDRQLDWIQQMLGEEDLHVVGAHPITTPAGRLLASFLHAVLRPDLPACLFSLATELDCAPNPEILRYFRHEMPNLILPALTDALNRRLGDWEKLREDALLSPIEAMRNMLETLCPAPAIYRSAAALLAFLTGGPQACLNRLEALPYGALPPQPEEIFLCRADHPDLPAADYLLLPFVTQTSERSEQLLRRTLTSAGRSLSVLTCGPGEPDSWQEFLERGLSHAADR